MSSVPIIIDDQIPNGGISAAEDSNGDEEGEEEQEQQFDDDSENNDDDEDNVIGAQAKKVRDLLATIQVPYQGENQPMIFSYHYKYEKYLKDNHLIDVSIFITKLIISLFTAGKS